MRCTGCGHNLTEGTKTVNGLCPACILEERMDFLEGFPKAEKQEDSERQLSQEETELRKQCKAESLERKKNETSILPYKPGIKMVEEIRLPPPPYRE